MKQRKTYSLRALLVLASVCGLWGARFWLVPAYYERTLSLGYYPPNADSIGIPIGGELIATVALFPVVVACAYFVGRNFPQKCTWLAWSKKQWGWSAFWTLLFAGFIWQTVLYLIENWNIKLPFNAAANVAWIIVWLEMRAVIVSKLQPRSLPEVDDAPPPLASPR